MPLSIIRFDYRLPGAPSTQDDRAEAKSYYAATLDMAEWADAQGFDMVVLSEHHASPDGFLPSPLVAAGAVAARTKTIGINIAALLVPLHDPVRLAEDIAVVDLFSGGRLSIVAGLGYRPVEYELLGKEWSRRGRLMDEAIEVLLKAWTGEPFEYRGKTFQVLPRPASQPHPFLMIGGSGAAAAKRAARFGLSLFPAVGDQDLAGIYYAECERLGTTPGMVLMPSGPGSVFVADDPDKAWVEVGPYLLRDAVTYKSWQTDDVRSHVVSDATTVDELRAEGTYQILTPDECIALAAELGPMGPYIHHPLCGGTPPELAWPSLELFVNKVMPHINDSA